MKTQAFAVDRDTGFDRVAAKVGSLLQDYPSWNSFDAYLHLIDELADSRRYRVLPGREFFTAPAAPEQVTVFLRHDLDFDPFTALRMAHAEAERRLHGSYYLLPTAAYYGHYRYDGKLYRYACMDWLYRAIAAAGHEIGIHNDLLTLMLEYDIDPESFQTQELHYYRQTGLEICGVCSHGSRFNPLGLNNTWMYAEFGRQGSYTYGGREYRYGGLTLRQFGFRYEPYLPSPLLTPETRLIDIGPDHGGELLNRIRQFAPGTACMLAVHPLHWKNQHSQRESM